MPGLWHPQILDSPVFPTGSWCPLWIDPTTFTHWIVYQSLFTLLILSLFILFLLFKGFAFHPSNRFSPVAFCKYLFISWMYLEYCHRAGPFNAATFEPLLESRCCHCLAGLRFGCFLRFLRCLRFAKPRYTEQTLRRVQFHVSPFHLFEISLLEGLPRKCIFFWVGFPMEPSATPNWSSIFCVTFVKQTLSSYLACSTEPSRSGIGAFPWNFTKALHLTRIYMRLPTLA